MIEEMEMPIFGHVADPGTWWNLGLQGSAFTNPNNGYVTKLSVWLTNTNPAYRAKCAVYRYSDLSLVAYSEEKAPVDGWNDFNIPVPVALSAGTQYLLVVWTNATNMNVGVTHTGVVNFFAYNGGTYGTFPATLPAPDWTATYEISIYATLSEITPPPPLIISVTPITASIQTGEQIILTATVQGGTSPYTVNWIDNVSKMVLGSGLTYPFSAAVAGTYEIYAEATDSLGVKATSAIVTITVTAPAPTQYTLSITATLGGTTDPSVGNYLYNSGSIVSIMATASSGYSFDHWMLDGANVGTSATYQVTMNSDHTLQAVFVALPPVQYILAVSASTGGTISPVPGSYLYNSGDTASITATANPGYIFDHWELDGVVAGSANPYLIIMDANHSLNTVFMTTGTPTTFGNTADPATWFTLDMCGSVFTAPDNGYATGITVAVRNWQAGYRVKCAIYRYSDLFLIGYTEEKLGYQPDGWSTFNIVGTVPLISGVQYLLVAWASNTAANIGVTQAGSTNFFDFAVAYDGFPAVLPAAAWTATYVVSIYCTLSATAPPPTATLTITSTTGGTTNPAPSSYPMVIGSQYSVMAIPNNGYAFDHWELDGIPVGTGVTYNGTLTADSTLNAVFMAIPPANVTLTVNSTPITGVPFTLEAL